MDEPVRQTVPLGPQWPCINPFLFCAHHDDNYPAEMFPLMERHGPNSLELFQIWLNLPAETKFADYEKTRFGGWPWDEVGPVHPADQGRFAHHAVDDLEPVETSSLR